MKRLILSLISIFTIVFASQAVTYTVTSNADGGTGSLRQALQDANGTPGGPHNIVFNAAMTITINSDLSIGAGNHVGLTINGFVDAVAGPDVTIRGNGVLNNKLFLNGSSSIKIYGLVFDNLEYGIQINNSTTCQVKGCYFGSNLAGSAAGTGIQHSGILISGGSGNIIGGINTITGGGTNNPERCLFVKCMQVNTGFDQVRYGAVLIDGSGTNQVINNYFGTDITGTTRLGNGTQATKMPLDHHNILIRNAAPTNVLDRNLITGATGCGIYIEGGAAGTIIKGNTIGLNAAANAKIPNEACGIYMEGSDNAVIGGATAIERNIISGNGGAAHNSYDDVCHFAWNDFNQYGIYAKNINGCVFKGNYIGTDATGNSSGASNVLGNRAGGIKIVTQEDGGGSSNNVIGGTNAGEGNVISGNGYNVGASIPNPTCNNGAASVSGITGGPGITLQYGTCSFNTILGNNIGLGADGVTALGNSQEGISILGASSNTIGGNTPAAANYIANNLWGIMMQIDFACHYNNAIKDCVNTLTKVAKDNIVIGNSIGVDRAGNAKGNGNRTGDGEGGGICLQMGASGNFIGRSNSGEGNVIAGNRAGIVFRDGDNGTYGKGAARNNFVYNNIIGDPTGTGALSNKLTPTQVIYGHGILMQVGTIGTTFPSGNIIGGVAANEKNIISGNQQSGIFLYHSSAVTVTTANSIIGNYIGTNVAGAADAGNTNQGIEIVNVNKTTITANLISGNDQNGISLTGSSTNTIQNNTIGSNSTKTAPIPNGTNGISLAAGSANNIIGGIAVNQPNFIFNNGANGVVVDGTGSTKNSIHQNSFSCNTARGIVLSNGGNGGYAAPAIDGNPTQITWTGGTFIEVYETDGCATCPSGAARLQGKKLVGSGPSPYVFDAGEGFDKTKTYTAIAHEANATASHNTSEFTQCYSLCQDAASVTITGSPLTFCEGGSVTLTANVTGGTGTPAYVWRRGGVAISGATASTYDASVSGSYSVDYSSTTSCGITSPANPTVVTVNPRPTVTSDPTGTVCSSEAQNYTITSSIPASFSWTRAAVAGITPATGSGSTNKITETLINAGTTALTVKYLITPTSTVGSCASTTPFTYTVTVNPKPAITSDATDIICSGTAQNYTITSSVPSAFTWSRTFVSGISNAAVTNSSSNPITEVLVNTTTTPKDVVYTITAISTTGSCSLATPFTYTVTVNPKPVITSDATDIVCSGTAQNYSITSNVPSSYRWSRAFVSGISNTAVTNSSANPITEALINTTTAPVDVIYTITATSTTGSCSLATPFTYTVTVNPKPVITSDATDIVCSGTAQNYSITSNVPSSYRWSRTLVTGISNAAVTNSSANPITEVLINTTTAPVDVIYTITATSTTGACSLATPFTYTVTVNPKPIITSADTDEVCSGNAQNYAITSNVSSTFAWSRGLVTGISNTAITNSSANPITEILINTTTSPIDVVYIVTATSMSGSCGSGSPFTYTVTVNPKPAASITASGPTAICSNGSIDLNADAAGFTGGTVEWFDGTTSLGNDNPLTVTTGGTYYVVYTATTTCASGKDSSITITIKPDVSPAVIARDTIPTCLDHVELVAEKPAVGTGTWSVVLPSTATVTPGAEDYLATGNDLVDKESYYFVFTVTGDCGTDSDTVFVPVGIDDFEVTASGPTDTLCVKTNRELTATVTGGSGNFTYVWGSSDGFSTTVTSTSSTSSITVNPTRGSTRYIVFVNDLTNIGCKAILFDSIEIHSIESQNLDIPNLITPNGDHLNDLFILRDKNEVNGVRIPFISEGSHLEIVNRWGSKVFEANNYKNDWDAKELSDGIYYYHITSSCGNKEYKSWIQILGNTNN